MVTNEFLGAASFFLALVAMIFAGASWFSIRAAHRHRNYEKRLTGCETDLLALLDRIDALAVVAKKKYSRDAVREHRARKSSGGVPDPSEDPEGWKKEMMKRHVLGKGVT